MKTATKIIIGFLGLIVIPWLGAFFGATYNYMSLTDYLFLGFFLSPAFLMMGFVLYMVYDQDFY